MDNHRCVTSEGHLLDIHHRTNQDYTYSLERGMSKDGLVFIGKVIDIQPIEGADFIASATVVCGEGGKWKGVVKKTDFEVGSHCVVFLPDTQLDPEIHDYLPFMKDSNWRVKMRRFKGAPSEVLITRLRMGDSIEGVGYDMTQHYMVTRYHKPVAPHLQGIAIGAFPSFIPKTDEPNYQREPELVDSLVGKPYYITEKADGSSTTAFRYCGEFGLCSRNLQLAYNSENGYWKIADKYELEAKLPEGYALQWETCGPGIQSNPMGLSEISGFAFSGYFIPEHRYLTMSELYDFCVQLKFPMCPIVGKGDCFSKEGIELLGEGLYTNGKQREGVVVRSQDNYSGKPISFKVINLGFEK